MVDIKNPFWQSDIDTNAYLHKISTTLNKYMPSESYLNMFLNSYKKQNTPKSDTEILKEFNNFKLQNTYLNIELIKYAFYTNNDTTTFCYMLFKIHCDTKIKQVYDNYKYIFDNIKYIKELNATFKEIKNDIDIKFHDIDRFAKLINIID